MDLFHKCLMKWHEPRTKVQLISPKGLLVLVSAIVLFSVLLGFMGGKYHFSNSFWAFAFMSCLPLAFVTTRLYPGYLIQLRDDAIVRKNPRNGSQSKARYTEIDTIYFERNCTHSLNNSFLYTSPHDKTAKGPKFTNFDIRMKGEVIVDHAIVSSKFSTIGCFSVPDTVDVEKVLQILRERGIKLIEQKSATS